MSVTVHDAGSRSMLILDTASHDSLARASDRWVRRRADPQDRGQKWTMGVLTNPRLVGDR
ncbi:hypothetical protein [Luteimonas cucumeris]|uniref:hypothetical protein n=1 Tax=Luteimonas cucumeris TaxID=985012 RepID=UPI00119EA8EC|nr:hypothetical protein [Luteimonas cucumeris]